MAQNRPFLQGIFDPVTSTEEDAGLLPGQQAVTPARPAAQPPAQGARPLPTRDDIIRRARELGIDPAVPLSIFSAESSGNFKSKDSPKGAIGGMQVMPGTYAQMMGTNDGQRDPWNNMEAGLRYIAHGQKVLGTKDPQLLAAGYHAGYGRPELKRGEIPNTHDGLSSTRDYAQKVAAGARKDSASTAPQYIPLTEAEINDLAAAGKIQPDYIPLTEEEITQLKLPPLNQAPPAEQGFLDRAGTAVSEGWDNTLQNLNTARFALGSGDSAELAQALAAKFAKQAATPKTPGQQEIDAAFQRVTDAKGAWDTTVSGIKAIGTALSNPADMAVEIAGQVPNMVPMLGGGAVGAGAGAGAGAAIGALGAGVGALPGAGVGAVWGSRAGMVAGTTATELGAEIEQIVAERLQQDKKPPSPENIKALLDSQEFRDKARNQGLAKGLTVGLVDQLFLGLGGKIAGAAGNAATVPGKVGLGAAAVGTDAAGEVIGEAASQQVARGKVDAGEALREGVMSLGQSAVEPVVGAVLQRRGTEQPAETPAAEAPPAEAAAPVEPAPAAPAPVPAPAAEPTPGLMTRAVEQAAAADAPTGRVTVTAPEGQLSGQVQAYQEDADGNFTAQILGDDGEVYQFTNQDGVQITPEAAPEPGPLSAALNAAAEDNAAAQVEPQNATQGIPEIIPDEAVAEQSTAPVAEDVQAETASAEVPSVDPIDAAVEKVAAERPRSLPEQLAGMDLPALQDRLQYIADQAKASGGWTKMFVDARNAVQREIRKRQKEADNARVDTIDGAPVAGDGRMAGGADVAPIRAAEPRRRARTAQPVPEQPTSTAETGAGAGPAVLRDGDAAFAEPALTDPHAGQSFDSELAARQYIAREKIGKTHRFTERAPGQFAIELVVRKSAAPKADKLAAADAKTARQDEEIQKAVEKAERRYAAKATQPQAEPEGKRSAVIERGEDGRITLHRREADGSNLKPEHFDNAAKAETERINWERGTSSNEKPLSSQESDLDKAATDGYEAGKRGITSPPYELATTEESDAWRIGNRRGREEQAAESAPETEPVDDLADIPIAFKRKTKVPHEVWVQDEGVYETVDVPAEQALASVREDITNLRALLDCLRS